MALEEVGRNQLAVSRRNISFGFFKLSTSPARAFSLIELIVVMAIFAIISVVVLANHSRFDSQVLLGSLAYNIALTIREAQVYGLSVQQYNNQFQVGYGVHVEKVSVSNPTADRWYLFFADEDASQIYENSEDGIVKQYTIGQHHSITKFCGTLSNGTKKCSDGSTAITITKLDIVFFRPNPDAFIHSNVSGDEYSQAEIWVSSPGGQTRQIVIVSTGQVSVKPGS